MICCICGRFVNEYGNNAWPVSEGRCCAECDWKVVIPARLALMQEQKAEMSDKN